MSLNRGSGKRSDLFQSFAMRDSESWGGLMRTPILHPEDFAQPALKGCCVKRGAGGAVRPGDADEVRHAFAAAAQQHQEVAT